MANLYISGWHEWSMRFALKEKIWPRAVTTEPSSLSLIDKPSNLGNTHTLFLFLLSLFSIVESTTARPSHLTKKCSLLSSRRSFVPSCKLPGFLPSLPDPTVSTPFLSAIFSSEVLIKQSQTALALESVPLATLFLQPWAINYSHDKISTTSGQSVRPQIENLAASAQTTTAI